ncbi:HAD family hydrolase [Clostridium senegalense]
MLTNIKAAIFDMDGTIVDSMWVWDKIDIDYLGDHKLEKPENLKDDIAHLSYNEVAIYFKDKFELPYTVEEIKKHWNDMAYTEYETNVKLKCGVEEFFKILKENNIKIALATSNSTSLLEACLKANDIYEYFDVITTTNEVSRGKDFPDVYLLTAERLGVKPEECLVFEDILPAVKGAKAANMKVVGVHDEHSLKDHEEMKKLVDIFIAEYNELIEKIK